ncbi:hypothetical protein [Actinomadura sp. 6N118]|uniref:hypothetical protein n=1 Tax=Actinomadura sp. 6N118 TaxID=3375151 RepID=UPI0037A1E348
MRLMQRMVPDPVDDASVGDAWAAEVVTSPAPAVLSVTAASVAATLVLRMTPAVLLIFM